MKVRFYFSLIITLLASSRALFSQENPDNLDRYGLDPLLYNGKVYTFKTPFNIKGNQFFSDEIFTKGSVILQGVHYKDIELNYDICNQQLLLKFFIAKDIQKTIEISNAWLEKFSLGDFNFEYISTKDLFPRIYQVLGAGRIRLLYYWKKNLKLDNAANSTATYVFESPVKECYVSVDNQIFNYRNKRGFVMIFEVQKQDKIKKYIHQNKIRIKKASDQKMLELINFCNNL